MKSSAKTKRRQAFEQVKAKQNEAEAEQRKKRSDAIKKILVAVSLFAVILALAAVITVNAVINTGSPLRSKDVVTCDGLSVNGTMFSYYFYDYFYTFANAYPEVCEQQGISVGNLGDVVYDTESGATWFDTLVSYASENVKNMLLFAGYAEQNNIAIGEREAGNIDSAVASMRADAEKAGLSFSRYLRKNYGRGVNEQDIRDFLGVRELAQLGMNTLVASLKISDEEIDKYIKDNSSDFILADYLYFVVEAPVANVTDDTERANIIEEYRKKADELAKCSDTESYIAYVKAFLSEEYAKDGKTLDDDTFGEVTDDMTVTAGHYSDATDIDKFIFSDERKPGDTFVYAQAATGTFGVVFIQKCAYTDETATYNVLDILTATESDASDILAAWKSGEQSKESFSEIARQKSLDSATAILGGLREDVTGGASDAIFTWCASAGRAAGDTSVITDESGIHVVYFVGNGRSASRAQTAQILLGSAATLSKAELAEKHPATVSGSASESIAKLSSRLFF